MFRVITSIAKTTVGEAVRRKGPLVILLIGMACLILAPGLNFLTPRSNQSAVVGLTLGVIQMTSALIAIVLTVYTIPNEIERRTIYTILCKPVQRWQFLVGKYLGALLALGAMLFAMTFILIFVTSVKSGGFQVSEAATMAKGPLMYFFQMSLLAAVAMMFSTFIPPLVNFFASSGVFIAGTVFSAFFDTIAGKNDAPMIQKAAAGFVQSVLPNFSRFNVQNPLINPTQQITSETSYYITNIGYAALYIVVAISIACMIFERREV